MGFLMKLLKSSDLNYIGQPKFTEQRKAVVWAALDNIHLQTFFPWSNLQILLLMDDRYSSELSERKILITVY